MILWSQYPLPFIPQPALPVLAVGNLKGGVGKTAIVSYLTLALAANGLRVLVIDLDFQASLTTSLAYIRLRPEHTGIIDFLLSDNTNVLFDYQVISPSLPAWKNITVVGANFDLADKEDALFAQLITGKGRYDPRALLAHKLSETTLQSDFDIVILDTPPRLTIASINALIACTHILIPTTPTTVSINGAQTFIALLDRLGANVSPRSRIMAVLPTMGVQRHLAPEIGRGFKSVDFWSDLHIPRRQAIANNAGLNDPDIQAFFQPLAERVAKRIGILPGETHEGAGIDTSARPSRASLPQ
ncbi:MAG: ParA family protein [Rhodomicrobium sp.]